MADLDFIIDIKIAQYWRKQLGDLGYVKYDPDDLRRWYDALETRGPDEIRAHLIERSGRHPLGEVTGIVAKAPHPPQDVIEIWLASHDRTSPTPYVAGASLFVVLCLLIGPNISSCQNLHGPKLFPHGSPPEASLSPGQAAGAPQTQATNPGQFPLPANVASPAAGMQNQQHGH